MARPGTLCIATVTVLVVLAGVQPGAAQFQSCHDATGCGGNEVTGVSTARECCLGSGLSFRDGGTCRQCIVHGFDQTTGLVINEGATQEVIRMMLDIKGNTLTEPASTRVLNFGFSFTCIDSSNGGGPQAVDRSDYTDTGCGSNIQLRLFPSAQRRSEVGINAVADDKIEGTEVLILRLVLTSATQTAVNNAGNIFFQDTLNIRVIDVTAVVIGFSEDDYTGDEGEPGDASRPNTPCTVTVEIIERSLEIPLQIQLTPREGNATRSDFNDTVIMTEIPVGQTQLVQAIQIFDDEINEGQEDFSVSLEVVGNISNTVQYRIRTTLCRIQQSDRVAQLSCYNATGCGGNEVTGVSTARECCLGSGLSFHDGGTCRQCIVHGFAQTTGLVINEGATQEVIRMILDIKGNTLLEPSSTRVLNFDFSFTCIDSSNGGGPQAVDRSDFTDTGCGSNIQLRLFPSAQRRSEVGINAVADDKIEGTEVLILRLVLTNATQTAVNNAGNIFFQDALNISVVDVTAVVIGFSEDDYTGDEGEPGDASRPNTPCTVTVEIIQRSLEIPLQIQLIPREGNATRRDFNDTVIMTEIPVGQTQLVQAIQIFDDEINEGQEDFSVSLNVVSNISNTVQYRIQTTLCRIQQSDRNCGVPRSPGNGTIANYTGTLEGSTVFYQCNFGFGPQGVLTARCTANGNWIPDPADVTCRKLVNCGVPRSPGNGTIANYTGTLEGSTVFYWCNRGFSPQGVLTAVCTANGNWIPDPADVTCRELVNCGAPRSPGNGTIANYTGTLEGSTVFYQCNFGFGPQSVLTAQCTANGNWIPDPADVTCRELVNCGVPRSPGNGTIANYTGTLEGSTVFYQCNLGFGPQGVLTARCPANGNWIPDPADVTCRELVDCGPPVTPQNGFLESYTDTTEGSEVFYSCGEHMVPEGRMTAVCTRNGWCSNPANLRCAIGSTEMEPATSSCSTSIAISVVVSCTISFIVAALVGAVVHCCAVRKKSESQKLYSGRLARKQHQKQQSASVYDEIVGQSNNIELKENVAYGPVKQ